MEFLSDLQKQSTLFKVAQVKHLSDNPMRKMRTQWGDAVEFNKSYTHRFTSDVVEEGHFDVVSAGRAQAIKIMARVFDEEFIPSEPQPIEGYERDLIIKKESTYNNLSVVAGGSHLYEMQESMTIGSSVHYNQIGQLCWKGCRIYESWHPSRCFIVKPMTYIFNPHISVDVNYNPVADEYAARVRFIAQVFITTGKDIIEGR